MKEIAPQPSKDDDWEDEPSSEEEAINGFIRNKGP